MPFLENLSIRRKLTLIITVTTCIAILLASGAFMAFDILNFRRSSREDLQTLAQVLGYNSTAAMAFNDPATGNEVLEALSAKDHILGACVYRSNGRLFSSYQRAGVGTEARCPPPEPQGGRFESGRLVVFRTILLENEPIGTIVLVSDLSELLERFRWYSAFFAVIVASLSAGAYVMAARMQRSISAPILSLAATTKEITSGKDYSIRVMQRTRGEVGVLVDGFNGMLAEIQRRDGELQRAQDELEQRVQERTRELRREIAVREGTETALRESEERTRLVLDSTAEGIFGLDLQSHCTFCNQATLRLLGLSEAAQLMQCNMHDVLHHTRSDGRPYPIEECPIARAVRAGQTCHRDDEVFWRTDGSSFPVEYWAHPVHSNGQTVGAVVTFIDITRRRAEQKALQDAKEAAESASRAKSEFLANMSHEIRTPMNGIIGMTELALETNLTEEQREFLGMVKLSADSLLVVINDILDFSKIEAGKMELETAVFNLRDLLEETVRAFAVSAGDKDLELACDMHPDVPESVAGDATRLRQVLVNLLGNALKFTDRGEIVLQAGVQRLHQGGADLHFAVRDTGIGIAKEKQGQIFEAFVQADGSFTRKYGGTGLGLTICNRLVSMMGGRMWLESEAGKGSTFHFSARFDLAPSAERPPMAEGRASLSGIPVLIVDDNPTNRRILEMTLAQWGMKPALADSGGAALTELRNAQESSAGIPLVILDAQMPQMDGFATAANIKADSRLGATTILMLTSGGQRGDSDRCRELGISAYLSKPARQSELREAILRVLGLKARGEIARQTTRQPLDESPRRLRILLAEDNAVNRELTMRILARRGHWVTMAVNGKLALEAAEREPFDLILMDVQMPEMDGFEATAAIRRYEARDGTHTPIIAMTAHAMKGDRERCLRAGMDGYIAKPVQPDELLKLAESLAAEETRHGENPGGEAEDAFDRKAALARVGRDESLLVDLARLFVEESPGMLAVIREAVKEKDPQRLERSAHSIKGTVSTFAAQPAFEAAARLEEMGRTGGLEQASQAWAILESEIGRLRAALDSLIAAGARVPGR